MPGCILTELIVRLFCLSRKRLLMAITPAVFLFIFLQLLMKLCFQKPYEFFFRLLHNSVYSAISFSSVFLFGWLVGDFGSFSLQIMWWRLFYLRFLSHRSRSAASKGTAQDPGTFGRCSYHELQKSVTLPVAVLFESFGLICCWGEGKLVGWFVYSFGGKGCSFWIQS